MVVVVILSVRGTALIDVRIFVVVVKDSTSSIVLACVVCTKAGVVSFTDALVGVVEPVVGVVSVVYRSSAVYMNQ